MLEPITPESLAAVDSRSFADPARFGALVARIDNEIEELARGRRNLALVRRNVAVICAVYAAAALYAQDALRGELARPKPAPTPVAARSAAATPRAGLPPVVALPTRGVSLTSASSF